MLNRVKKNGTRCLLQVGVRDWESLGASPSMIQKRFCETVAEVMDAEAEGEGEIHPSKRQRVAERVPIHAPPEVEPENHGFDVNEFLLSSPNPVVASVFGDSEILRRAAVHRGYPVTKSWFPNFGDDAHDQSITERILAKVQRIQPRLLVLAFPSREKSAILIHATSPQVRERIDTERAAELTILDSVVSLCEVQETAGNMFLVENPAGANSWNQPSIQRLRNAPFVFEDISHFCMFGVKDPRSRRALKRPVRYLTNSRELLRFVVRKCPSKHVHGSVQGLTNAYRSSSRWHTRAWGQAVIRGVESDVVKRLEAYPAEDVEMELPGTAIPDDDFHEEPHLEEANVPEEIPNGVRLAVMRIHKNLGHPSKVLLCRALRATFVRRVNLQKATCLRSWQIRAPNSIKVSESIYSYLRTQTNKCLSS